jgi:hypothetical protein
MGRMRLFCGKTPFSPLITIFQRFGGGITKMTRGTTSLYE